MPCVYSDAIDVLSVPKRAASKEHLVSVQRVYLSLQLQLTLKVVDELVFFITVYLTVAKCAKDLLLATSHLIELFQGLLVLEVSFSIEVLSFNIADTLRQRTVYQ